MPTNPPVFRPAGAPPRQEQKRDADRARRRDRPWRKWYNLRAWQDRRATQLMLEPICERCKPNGMVIVATIANHETPHRGDWSLFIGGELQSLCKRCHDSDVQAEERAALRHDRGG